MCNKIYKCNTCGNLIETLTPSESIPSCCGNPMTPMTPNTQEAAHEKHIPVINGNTVTVGSVAHPMQEAHHIAFIELITPDSLTRKSLKPGENPSAQFDTIPQGATVRAYCNLHGLWQNS